MSARQQRRKARSGKAAILIHISANARADACGAPADAGEPLRRTTADAKKPKKWPRVHFRRLRNTK